MTDTLTLHGMGSPNVMKVIIMLEELGLPYALRHVAVFKQEQFDPAFLALNPIGKVPVLEDPSLGIPLAESGAILLWLAEREGRFLPTEQPARAEVMQWLMVQMANVGPMFGQLNHFNLVPPGSEPYACGRYRAIAGKLYRDLDRRLADRPWLAGDAYSIADIATQPWANYLERHGFDPSDYPALLDWRARIAGRPAVQRARERADEAFHASRHAVAPVSKRCRSRPVLQPHRRGAGQGLLDPQVDVIACPGPLGWSVQPSRRRDAKRAGVSSGPFRKMFQTN